jgi:uncharacterized protein (TIGR02118 family)
MTIPGVAELLALTLAAEIGDIAAGQLSSITHEQCLEYWSGQHHTQLVSQLPGLTRWRQNHVVSAPGEPVCDGIGELWFDSDESLETALSSSQMAAAVKDAENFLDMARTGLVIVHEKMPIG